MNSLHIKHFACAGVALALVACNADEPAENEPETGEIVEEAAENAGKGVREAGEEISAAVDTAAEETGKFIENELSQSNARGLTVRNVIGETIRDKNGQAAAIVEDLLFDDSYILRAFALRDGAFMGIGGDKAVIGADKVSFSVDADGDVGLSATVTNSELQQMTESLAHEPSDGSILSPGNLISVNRLIGRSIVNENNDKVAELFDILLAPPAQWRSYILSVGGVGPVGNRLVQVERSMLNIDSTSGRLVLDASVPDFAAMTTFEYEGPARP